MIKHDFRPAKGGPDQGKFGFGTRFGQVLDRNKMCQTKIKNPCLIQI